MVVALSVLAVLQSLTIPEPLQALGKRYNIKISVLPKAFKWESTYGYSIAGDAPTQEELDKYAPIIVKEWNLYPPSFIAKAGVKEIVIGDQLAVDGQRRSAIPLFETDTMYYDPAFGAWDLHYQRNTVHHEFFHMVDWKMYLLGTDATWAALNVKPFKYGNGGVNMRNAGAGELTRDIPGFLTPYGTSAVEEDKAELFSHLVIDPNFVGEQAKSDKVLVSKVALLKQRLRRFDPAMGEAFWKQAFDQSGTATVKRGVKCSVLGVWPDASHLRFAFRRQS